MERSGRREARTYANLPKGGVRQLVREARGLYAGYASWSAADHVETVLSVVRRIEDRILQRHAMELVGKDILDVGTGQQLIQLQYFARQNRATGIDLDVIARGPHPAQYVRMLRLNGAGRTVKTIIRKALGIDVRHARALRAELGSNGSSLRVERMDVCGLEFAANTFDFVFCSSLLHHLPDPGKALEEMGRVLRPGGVACAGLQLYTSDTGSRDPGLIRSSRREGPAAGWPHLRAPRLEEASGLVRVNGLRLADWQSLFERHWPGFHIVLGQPERARLEPVARKLQDDGELLDYSIEELVTHDLWVDWQKPHPPGARAPGRS